MKIKKTIIVFKKITIDVILSKVRGPPSSPACYNGPIHPGSRFNLFRYQSHSAPYFKSKWRICKEKRFPFPRAPEVVRKRLSAEAADVFRSKHLRTNKAVTNLRESHTKLPSHRRQLGRNRKGVRRSTRSFRRILHRRIYAEKNAEPRTMNHINKKRS